MSGVTAAMLLNACACSSGVSAQFALSTCELDLAIAFCVSSYIYFALSESIMEALLLVAAQLAAEMMTWDFERQERLEACREGCRNICLIVGIGPTTECLAKLWTIITIAQVNMEGFDGVDINSSSMGVPPNPPGWRGFSQMNPNRQMSYREDMKVMKKILPNVEALAPELRDEVLSLCGEVESALI